MARYSMTINLTCPFCLGQAVPSEWGKEVELLECLNCNRIWFLEHHQRLWDRYQINGKAQDGSGSTHLRQ